MSVVVFGLLMQKFTQPWFAVLALCCIFLVGFSRVYSRARFPHQVLGSWVGGFVGLQTVGNMVRNHMKIEKMVRPHQWWLVGVVVMVGLIHLALCVENNDSRLAHVSKKEFTRVMVDIMNGTTTAAEDSVSTVRGSDGTLRRVQKPLRDRADNTGVLPDADAGSARGRVVTPRSATIRQAAELELRRSAKYYDRVKHDSFYHLQKGMMLREARRKGESGSSLLAEEEDYLAASPGPSPLARGRGGGSARDGISFREYRTARSSGSARSQRQSASPANSGYAAGTTPRV